MTERCGDALAGCGVLAMLTDPDLRGELDRVAAAVGEGSAVVSMVHEYLETV